MSSQRIDIAIVGAGMQALTLVTHLLQKRQKLYDRITVFDPSGKWIQQWQHQFAAQEIPHLRSPVVHHPEPDSFALRRFAESKPNQLFPPYDLPGTELYESFCWDVIQRWQLQNHVMAAKVIRVEPLHRGFRLGLEDGQTVLAQRVVMATGSAIAQVPEWVNQIATPYPDDRLVHSQAIDLRLLKLAGERILIVGGGLTSGHLAIGAINRGATVSLMSRRSLTEKLFDADPGWLGPKYLKGFHAEVDWFVRWQMIQQARNGGSLTPAMMTQLRRAKHSNRLNFYPECQVIGAKWQGQCWQVTCEDGEIREYDRIWLATGTRFDITADPVFADMLRVHPIQVVNGLPVLDPCLRWAKTELFVMGGLAGLQVGPTARNLSGARMASDRIVPALIKPRMLVNRKSA
ncbi:MAG: lysine N(6)-hydroxylase/L-ornithine N(5)-oxygenase family protein [Leptolyngbya sp. Prado105]|jgi:cation diffusion facilitator CzcD-associated flavoprotein CzcO|nr:lysine N(6)-hydroxylase/L-ornithine N(5)-oxygenase family protein [Leptolyngbya sp. Prado105]